MCIYIYIYILRAAGSKIKIGVKNDTHGIRESVPHCGYLGEVVQGIVPDTQHKLWIRSTTIVMIIIIINYYHYYHCYYYY